MSKVLKTLYKKETSILSSSLKMFYIALKKKPNYTTARQMFFGGILESACLSVRPSVCFGMRPGDLGTGIFNTFFSGFLHFFTCFGLF